jgi:hypothetical protein
MIAEIGQPAAIAWYESQGSTFGGAALAGFGLAGLGYFLWQLLESGQIASAKAKANRELRRQQEEQQREEQEAFHTSLLATTATSLGDALRR